MKIKITGTVVRVTQTEVRGKDFHFRNVHVETDNDNQYSQIIEIQLTGDRCKEGDALAPGQVVEFECDLRGREWTDPKTGNLKVFNTIISWRFTITSGNTAPTPDVPLFQNAPVPTQTTQAPTDDDLPF
jgi:hypothetical protein